MLGISNIMCSKNNTQNNIRPWIPALVLLFAAQTATMQAATYTFATGSLAADMSSVLADGDTVAISGSASTLELSGSRTVDVSNWVQPTDTFNLGSRTDIVFKPISGTDEQWAVLRKTGSGRVMTIAPAASGTTVLELNNVVLANGAPGGTNNGGALLVSSACGLFLLKGDVVFYNNSGRIGGGMAALGSVTFAGNATFDSNTNNAAGGYGGGFSTTGNMASAGAATITFEKNAVFINNASGATSAGGGMYAHRGHLLRFKGDVVFKDNKAGSSGGGIYAPSAAGFPGTITFMGDVLFDSNSSSANGGGIFAGDLIDVLFTDADAARVASFVNNSIVATAGATKGGAIRAGSVAFNTGTLNVRDNAAGSPATTTAEGGGVYVEKALTIDGDYDFSRNEALGSGGGTHVGGTARFVGSGSFAGNKALTNGGAIYIVGNTLDISGAAVFDGNVAGGLGGAIYASNAVSLTLSATSGDIVFQNNTQGAMLDSSSFATTKKMTVSAPGSSNAVYFAGVSSTLNIRADAGYAVRFFDAIDGMADYVLTLNKSGDGDVYFAHDLTASATTTVSEGRLIIQNGATYGSGTESGLFVVEDGAGVSGNGSIRAQTISIGEGSYLGATDGGLLLIEGETAPTIGSGLILGGSGTISVTGVSAFDAAEVRIGDGKSAGTLTIEGDLSLTDATISLSLHDNDADKLMITGNATVSGSKTINILSLAGSGTFGIGNVKEFYGADTKVLIAGEEQETGARQTASVTTDGVNLQIATVADISRILYWSGSTSAAWNTTASNWTDDSSVNKFAGGDRAVFDATHDSANADRREITIGENGVRISDMIVQNSGTYIFAGAGGITASTDYVIKSTGSANIDDAQGKLIKDGDGVLRFENEGDNIFRGGIDIKGGAIVFNRAGQLGDGGNGINFLGTGTLQVAGNNIVLTNAIAVNAGNNATLDTQANAVTVSGSVTGAGNFIKTGIGTLTLTGSNLLSGTMTVSQGTLQGAAQSLGSKIKNESALVFDQGGEGEFSGEITGTGAITKKGAGALLVSGSVTSSTFRIDEGVVTLAGANVTLAATTGFTVSAASALTGIGTIRTPLLSNSGTIMGAKAAGNAEYGRLTIEGDYAGSGGSLILGVAWQGDGAVAADQLYITGSATGATSLVLGITGTEGLSSDNTTLVHADGGFANGENTFVLAERYVLPNGKDAILEYGEDGDLRIASTFSPEAAVILGVDASGFLIGKASLDSLGTRMTALRLNNQTGHNYDLWMSGMHRHDKITSDSYAGSKFNTQGVQVGIDTVFGDDTRGFAAGVFYDYAKSDMHQRKNTASARTESNGGGIYAMYRHGAFYLDGIMRGSRETYQVTIPGTRAFEMDGDSWAASMTIGYVVKGDLDWNADPEIQVTCQSHRIDNATDQWGRVYHTETTRSLNTRAGVRLWTQREWKSGRAIVPYIRASYEYEFDGDGLMTVENDSFKNSLSGGGFIVDAGVSMQLGARFNIDARGSWFYGAKINGYNFNLGCGFNW